MTILCDSILATMSAALGLAEGGAVAIGGEPVGWPGAEGALPAVFASQSASASLCVVALSPQVSMPTQCSGSPALADIAIWDAFHPAELSYRMGTTPIHTRIFGGQLDA